MRFEQRQRLANTPDPKQHGKDPAPVLKSIYLSMCLPCCCLTLVPLANKASFEKCYTLNQHYHCPNEDLSLSSLLMGSNICCQTPEALFFLALAAEP